MNRGATDVKMVSIPGIGKMQMALTDGLLMIYQKLGRPGSDINNNIFWIMVDQIVEVWSKVFPHELAEFKETVQIQRETERSISSSVKKGLIQNYAIPAGLFKMLKSFFPLLPFTDKKFTKKFTSRYPFFKTTEHKI